MTQIDTILEKERTNTDNIYVYMLHDRFIAFGYSAYFAALLCPKLEVQRGHTDAAGSFVCLCIPDDYVRSFSPKYPTLVNDEYICIVPPFNICRQQDYFPEWQERQLHLAP